MSYCGNPFGLACQYDSDCDTDITDNSFGSLYQFDSSEDEDMDSPNEKYPDKDLQGIRKENVKDGDVSTFGRKNLKDQSTKHDPKFVLHSVLYTFKSERFPFLVSFVTLPVSILKENRQMGLRWYHGVFYVPRHIPSINKNPTKPYLTFDPITYGLQSINMSVECQKLLRTIILQLVVVTSKQRMQVNCSPNK